MSVLTVSLIVVTSVHSQGYKTEAKLFHPANVIFTSQHPNFIASKLNCLHSLKWKKKDDNIKELGEFRRQREESLTIISCTCLSKTTAPLVALGANHTPRGRIDVRLLEQRIARHPYFPR